MNARLRNGVQLQAGTNTGQRVTDYCEIRAKLPGQTGGFSTGSEVPAYSAVNPYCHYAPGITTRATAAGSYTIPKIDVLLSGDVPEQPRHPARGQLHRARAPSSRSRSGDRCPATSTNVTINLLKPGRRSEASASTSSTSASARSCASAGSGRPFRPTCSTR